MIIEASSKPLSLALLVGACSFNFILHNPVWTIVLCLVGRLLNKISEHPMLILFLVPRANSLSSAARYRSLLCTYSDEDDHLANISLHRKPRLARRPFFFFSGYIQRLSLSTYWESNLICEFCGLLASFRQGYQWRDFKKEKKKTRDHRWAAFFLNCDCANAQRWTSRKADSFIRPPSARCQSTANPRANDVAVRVIEIQLSVMCGCQFLS